jgi:excinuclease ABC subunit C
MTQEAFKIIAPTLPKEPGVYKYFDKNEKIIYVGKAKNLYKRVSSYFNKNLAGYKTYELVQRICRIEYTVVDSEQDAFFLENALIKELQPKYNIDLKDDKSYPYIVIKKEPFPRIFLTRRKINDGSEYLGPFTSVARVRELLTFIKQHVQLRTCKLPLTAKNIQSGKFKVCLEYHLGNCKGPCANLQTAEDYMLGIEYLRQILKGKLGPIRTYYNHQLKEHIDNLAFEKAALIQKKIEHLENYSARTVIVNKQIGDIDVFNLLKDDDIAFVNYLMVRDGTIVQTHTLRLETQLDETEAEVLSFAMLNIRTTFGSDASEIVVPFMLDYPESKIKLTVALAGERKKLLDLSLKNVLIYRDEIRRRKILNVETKGSEEMQQLLAALQQDLHLPALPLHIECFDNSNFQGHFPVSAMVCFKNGIPSKTDYRHFNVKTVKGIDDFATMEEAVYRRYKRLKEENAAFPQLVIIDGGKGQLNAAQKAIKALELDGKLTMVGLAKNEEEIFYQGDKESLKLPWDSASLKFIRRIRDEVHRFGISFHRNQRSKGTFKNDLESITGIGKSTATVLLKHFKSVKKVREATEDDIAKLIGPSKAALVVSHFANAISTS